MKNTEKRIMHLNPEIIEAFENDEEMLLIKGGVDGKFWKWLKDTFGGGGINICNNCPNTGTCS